MLPLKEADYCNELIEISLHDFGAPVFLTWLGVCRKMWYMTNFSFTHDRDGDKISTVSCLDCGFAIELHSRGLCATCYQRNRRNGTLDEFPTTYFLSSPEEYVYWAVKHYPELVKSFQGE